MFLLVIPSKFVPGVIGRLLIMLTPGVNAFPGNYCIGDIFSKAASHISSSLKFVFSSTKEDSLDSRTGRTGFSL
jgi:hypothetical protein